MFTILFNFKALFLCVSTLDASGDIRFFDERCLMILLKQIIKISKVITKVNLSASEGWPPAEARSGEKTAEGARTRRPCKLL